MIQHSIEVHWPYPKLPGRGVPVKLQGQIVGRVVETDEEKRLVKMRIDDEAMNDVTTFFIGSLGDRG